MGTPFPPVALCRGKQAGWISFFQRLSFFSPLAAEDLLPGLTYRRLFLLATCAALLFTGFGAAADRHLFPDDQCVLCQLNAHTPVQPTGMILLPIPELSGLFQLPDVSHSIAEVFPSIESSRGPPASALFL